MKNQTLKGILEGIYFPQIQEVEDCFGGKQTRTVQHGTHSIDQAVAMIRTLLVEKVVPEQIDPLLVVFQKEHAAYIAGHDEARLEMKRRLEELA